MVVLAQQTVNELLERLSVLEGVESVLRLPILPAEYEEPLFSLKLDVFLRHGLPGWEDRKKLLPEAKFFEASRRKPKDRFFWQSIPIHIEYKLCEDWEKLLSHAENTESHWDVSTYPLFRVAEGVILREATSWIHTQKERLLNLPGAFFVLHLNYLRDKLEHLTADLSMSVIAKDKLMFHMTLGNFLETLVESWFTANKNFMPPFDQALTRMKELEYLPEGALGFVDVLTRADVDIDRRLEVARKAARNIG